MSTGVTCAECNKLISRKEHHHRLRQADREPTYYHTSNPACHVAALKTWKRRGGSIRYMRPEDPEMKRR